MASRGRILPLAAGLVACLAVARAEADPAYVQVSGDRLSRCGAPLRLKGSNLEGNRHTSNTIWRQYWSWRDEMARSLDQARTMGSNSIRLVFPDQAIDLDPAGAAQAYELDKLVDVLSLLDAGGMGAIVTVFNRHAYANGDRARDARKIGSFLARFGGDRRVLLWDIVNEPQPMG